MSKGLYRTHIKRVFDVLICLIALPFFAVLYVIIGLMIKVEDGGPVFYVADRLGLAAKPFGMYKFRSMTVGSPLLLTSDGSTYSSRIDPRVTRVGRVIRETSLDEIPQILNVLKGHMSIIGPRASLISALGSYQEDEMDKMRVRPGITGYSQAYHRNSIGNRDKRLKDAWYANNVSLWLDMKILLKTLTTVILRKHVHTTPSEVTVAKRGEKSA